MNWFGLNFLSPMYEEGARVPTPVGQKCKHCQEAIKEDDNGFVTTVYGHDGAMPAEFHRECYLRPILGGLNHQMGRCICCGGDQPADPPGLTAREAAQVAVRNWESRHRY